jgi:hypothetical protein
VGLVVLDDLRLLVLANHACLVSCSFFAAILTESGGNDNTILKLRRTSKAAAAGSGGQGLLAGEELAGIFRDEAPLLVLARGQRGLDLGQAQGVDLLPFRRGFLLFVGPGSFLSGFSERGSAPGSDNLPESRREGKPARFTRGRVLIMMREI